MNLTPLPDPPGDFSEVIRLATENVHASLDAAAAGEERTSEDDEIIDHSLSAIVVWEMVCKGVDPDMAISLVNDGREHRWSVQRDDQGTLSVNLTMGDDDDEADR